MAKRSIRTPLQREYQKQRKRIQQFINRATKRGYEFQSNLVPTMPKRVTRKSIERIKNITPEQLYKKARYGGEASGGEIVSGTEGKKLERKQAARKAAETRKYNKPDVYDYDYTDYYGDNERDFTYEETYSDDTTFYDRVVISNFKETARAFRCKDMLISWVNRCVSVSGEHATAQMIQTAAENGIALGIALSPSDKQEKVSQFLSEMLSYMEEAGQFTKDEIMEAMEMEETYEPV